MGTGAMPSPLSKKVSWLLRHGASDVHLAMDDAGWVTIDDLLAVAKLDRSTLEQIVATNPKRRFEIQGDRIRACQGHSAQLAVTREALEASWSPFSGGLRVWHGTQLSALVSIGRTGLLPQSRTHVHLSPEIQSRIGKRADVQVLLAVSTDRMRAADQRLWVASNGVVLARHVPPSAIESAMPVGPKGRLYASTEDGPFPWLREEPS